MSDFKKRTAEEWKAQLSDLQYRVTREAATEHPFTGEYTSTTDDGIYTCICCGTELFRSNMKFDSGCGWPSFFTELADANIEQRVDNSLGVTRTEIVCSTCEAHLGHVFADGPEPTGLRYCVNSASLDFAPLKAGDKIEI